MMRRTPLPHDNLRAWSRIDLSSLDDEPYSLGSSEDALKQFVRFSFSGRLENEIEMKVPHVESGDFKWGILVGFVELADDV